MQPRNKRKKAAAAAAAAVASAGVLVGGVFAAPGELLDDGAAPVLLQADTEDDAGAPDEEAPEERRGLRERCRVWALRLPRSVRALVGVPLWCVGWLLVSAAQLLWAGLLSPLASRFGSWILLAAALVGVFVLGAKAAFPELPLKKPLRRRHILPLLGGICVLGMADALLPLFWAEYEDWSAAVGMAGSFALVLAALCLFARREAKRRQTQSPPPETQRDALRRVLEMADSAK